MHNEAIRIDFMTRQAALNAKLELKSNNLSWRDMASVWIIQAFT